MTRRLVRGCLLASPFLFGAVGCMGGPQVNSASTPTNGVANANVTRAQQQPEITPAKAITLPPTTLADGTVAVQAVAYVNHSPVYESELRDAVNQRARDWANFEEPERTQKRKQVEREELDKLIERELILEIALAQLKKVRPKSVDELYKEAGKEFDKQMRKLKDNFKIETDEQFKQFLSAQGASLDGLRRQSERAFLSMEYMRNIIFPKIQTIPMSDIKEYYDTHPDEFMDQNRAKWQGIFLDATKFSSREAAAQYAEKVAAGLRAGGNFAATATQLRQAGYNVQLSDVGVGEKPGEIRPAEVEPVVFRLKAGEVGPVVEMPGGFQIVRVVERNYAAKRPFTLELQSEIRKKVQAVCWEREYRNVVEEMKGKAVIQKVNQ
jgi:parvulin-like peptidyl-prolyl isomerase